VKDVKAQKIVLNDGTEVPYGLLVWSTGVGPSPIIQSLDLPKAPGGRLVTLLNIVAFTSHDNYEKLTKLQLIYK
jgi:NADH dehydrogenase FAD-containing subunit